MWLVRCLWPLVLALALAACGGSGSGTNGNDASIDDPSVPHGFLVRWQASSEAAGYVVHWGAEPGIYTRALDVGAPVPDAGGVVSFVLDASGEPGVLYVALTSYDDAYRMSAFSNEIAVSVH